ncbi:hypothetical protein BJ979_001148 [Schumannella luteola]|uniref:Uncharacterized protein n=1 Tax=Schumannella luteola TaxID=472059 RepID=A0A852Y9I5_9MICO|nr:hypothetical protein [Schumannella luteola]NYG98522.1 hypothetical protein [Schumannella luteola]
MAASASPAWLLGVLAVLLCALDPIVRPARAAGRPSWRRFVAAVGAVLAIAGIAGQIAVVAVSDARAVSARIQAIDDAARVRAEERVVLVVRVTSSTGMIAAIHYADPDDVNGGSRDVGPVASPWTQRLDYRRGDLEIFFGGGAPSVSMPSISASLGEQDGDLTCAVQAVGQTTGLRWDASGEGAVVDCTPEEKQLPAAATSLDPRNPG